MAGGESATAVPRCRPAERDDDDIDALEDVLLKTKFMADMNKSHLRDIAKVRLLLTPSAIAYACPLH